ncbi:uncharacterized protein LOC129753241 [Uranotaenia lowii]|uniref:uncharacterized protein LOC129753241 n=1 Tax=Uranotaenia lowii TaxID=190385 RepID=UPI0024795997|nr:uncharacterized protein LOC129753241 [Uranotaenia lowii]
MATPPSSELMESLTRMLADALKSSLGATLGQAPTSGAMPLPKPPSFSVPEFRSSDDTSVSDYLIRFEWALELSKIPIAEYAHYARVFMGTELNSAIKFLVSPRNPAEVEYDELRTTLINHFDQPKNKYVESIKFREIVQQKEESITSFALRLKQGAVHCEYDTFLDRMLIEQLLNGLDSREMCDEIVAKKPTTFKEAFDIAHTLEAIRNAAGEVRTAKSFPLPESTNKLGYEKPSTRKPTHHPGSSTSYQHKQQVWREPTHGHSVCSGCGGDHARSQCKYRNAPCYRCGKKGHIAQVCRSSDASSGFQNTAQVHSEEQPASQIDLVHSLSKIHSITKFEKRFVNVSINGHNVEMEVDTGAPCGIISEVKLRMIKPNSPLLNTDRQFSSYTGHRIQCRLPVTVGIGSTTRKLDVYVVSGDYDSLFGREWISQFSSEINLNELFGTKESVKSLLCTTPVLKEDEKQSLEQLLEKFDDVFSEKPGMLTGPPASVHLKPGVTPVFAKARDVPLALKAQYAAEIDQKLASGIYERVDYSEWASPTHIVVKKNGKLRITGNYKPTVNSRMIIDEHPIPKIESIFNQMRGARLFCHLDVTDAYTHLPIDEDFRHVLTLNTPTHGLVRPTRAVYGAANIPAIWQRRMEIVLQGNPRMDKWVPGVIAERLGDLHYYIDFGGKRFKRHIDQIRPRIGSPRSNDIPRRIRFYENDMQTPSRSTSPGISDTSPPLQTTSDNPVQQDASSTPVIVRRSTRDLRPPRRYSP